MWRKVLCMPAFLGTIYLLMSACMQAWLTAADVQRVGQHQTGFYLYLAAALACYVLFGVLLRPRSVLHFCLCTLSVPVALYSLACIRSGHAQFHSWLLLGYSSGYLLWRLSRLIRRLNAEKC